MSLYEGIKDDAKVMQKSDNVELYKELLDLSSQALAMQAEITRLKGGLFTHDGKEYKIRSGKQIIKNTFD